MSEYDAAAGMARLNAWMDEHAACIADPEQRCGECRQLAAQTERNRQDHPLWRDTPRQLSYSDRQRWDRCRRGEPQHPPMRQPCGCPLDADCTGYHPGALDGWPP